MSARLEQGVRGTRGQVADSVDDPAAALAEISRTLPPGGRLPFLEHVRSDEPSVARCQHNLTRASRLLGGGCHLNRDTVAAIQRAGLLAGSVGG